MTIVVPFDGGELSRAALRRGGELGRALDQQVVAVSVIPASNAEYAREQGWIDQREQFDSERVVSHLSEQVYSLTPGVAFEYEVVGRYAQPGEIASKLRRTARKKNADIVVLGSDNAGHIVTSVSSVASPIAADGAYDVLIVRHTNKHEDHQ